MRELRQDRARRWRHEPQRSSHEKLAHLICNSSPLSRFHHQILEGYVEHGDPFYGPKPLGGGMRFVASSLA
jgi:hypothetical protein